ncbi:zinc ribbon domain-containing protein [Bacillus sp. JCM 19034]|uniref:zinc ribbon domain-containing protein n=1 Tax=Bacillus sp. JCM 19034 TaxID=1481928 RepID=UPI000785F6B7|nr:zinc ribbon domain-containing protein [Bacillus sp. JCM 19034]
MVINFCPTCGANKEEEANFCPSCGLNYNLVKIENQQDEMDELDEGNQEFELKTESKKFSLNKYSTYVTYIVNSCMVLNIIWLYFVARNSMIHGDYSFLAYLAPVLLIVLFLIASLYFHSRFESYALFGNLGLTSLAFVPFFILFLHNTNVYSNGLIPQTNQLNFIIIAILPLTVLSIIVLSIISIVIWKRITKNVNENKEEDLLEIEE